MTLPTYPENSQQKKQHVTIIGKYRNNCKIERNKHNVVLLDALT